LGRLARAAAFSLFQLVVVLAVVAGAVDAGLAGAVVLVASVPVALTWGHVHADVALNGALDDVARRRWRIAVWCVPGAVALYWMLYVRPRRID
jgi:hypothetical protein